MLVTRDLACSTPSSVTPLTAADSAASQSAVNALALAVGNAQAAVNSILTRSPLDFAWAGRNLMIDVARSNAEHGAPGYVGEGSVIPGVFSNVAGSCGQPGPVVGGPANQGWWSGWKPGGYRNGAPVAPVLRRRICAYKPGFIGQGECVPDAAAVDTSVARLPSNPPAPQTTIPPIDSTGLPALPAASSRCASPSGNICLDLRNGVVLASRVSADVLYQCSQKGYAGNCPSCDPGGPQINVSAAQLAAIPAIDSATLGPCPNGVGLAGLGRRGLGGSAYPVSTGAYPLSCMASPGSAADAAGSLDNPISGWWWLLLAAGAVWAVSASGKQQRRAG